MNLPLVCNAEGLPIGVQAVAKFGEDATLPAWRRSWSRVLLHRLLCRGPIRGPLSQYLKHRIEPENVGVHSEAGDHAFGRIRENAVYVALGDAADMHFHIRQACALDAILQGVAGCKVPAGTLQESPGPYVTRCSPQTSVMEPSSTNRRASNLWVCASRCTLGPIPPSRIS